MGAAPIAASAISIWPAKRLCQRGHDPQRGLLQPGQDVFSLPRNTLNGAYQSLAYASFLLSGLAGSCSKGAGPCLTVRFACCRSLTLRSAGRPAGCAIVPSHPCRASRCICSRPRAGSSSAAPSRRSRRRSRHDHAHRTGHAAKAARREMVRPFLPGVGTNYRGLRPDVIHLWEEPWSFVALQAALLRRGAALVIEADQNILKRLPPPFETIRRFVLRRTGLVLSRSPDATAVVRACGFAGPVRPIGYGVDQAAVRALPRARTCPARLRTAAHRLRWQADRGKGSRRRADRDDADSLRPSSWPSWARGPTRAGCAGGVKSLVSKKSVSASAAGAVRARWPALSARAMSPCF